MNPSLQKADDEQELTVLRRQLDEVTDAFVATNDQLLALYRIADFSSITLDPLVAIDRIVQETLSVLQADRAMFMKRSDEGDLSIGASVTSATVPARIDEQQKTAWLETGHAHEEAWIDHNDAIDRSRVCVPVQSEEHFPGLLVAEVQNGRRFTTAELKLAGALSGQLSMMLELSSMHDAAVKRTIVERDYETASALAQAALKRSLPEVPGLKLAAFNRSAREAGGDFYAAQRTANGVYIAVGDVSGKGLPAALIMTTTISATYDGFDRSPDGDVSAVMTDIDRQLSSYLTKTGMFVTLAVAYIDLDAMRLELYNAGQSPVSLMQGGMKTTITADGPPVGVLPPQTHECSTWMLDEDALLFIGTDGWTDQENPEGRMFGDEGVDAVLCDEALTDAQDVLDTLLTAIEDFGDGTDQADDLTAVVINRVTEGLES